MEIESLLGTCRGHFEVWNILNFTFFSDEVNKTNCIHQLQLMVNSDHYELPNVEGISIHWHGIHQRGTTRMDGVAFISQKPILTHQKFMYKSEASPSGTHWYHAHSGAHRTDGLYGALIVKDNLFQDLYYGVEDQPENHTLLLATRTIY